MGGAYLFERHKTKPNDWALRKVLIGADSAAGGRFGKAVGLSADKIVIGAPDAAGSGAAYLFLRDQGGPANWGQAKKWAGPAAGAKFGAAVAIDTEVAAVGLLRRRILRDATRHPIRPCNGQKTAQGIAALG